MSRARTIGRSHRKRSTRWGGAARLVAEAAVRRKPGRLLAQKREKRGLSQTVVAAMMATSASLISKLEAGVDVKLSTLQRYRAAIGEPLGYGSKAPSPAR